VEQAEAEVHERAEFVFSLFEAMGRNEQALLDLMSEHSDDSTIGGFYDNIAKMQYQSSHFQAMRVVSELEDWLFDNRTVGDSELIYTADFGYHIVYFTGEGDVFSELMAKDRMRTRDLDEWMEGLHRGEPKKHAAFILVDF